MFFLKIQTPLVCEDRGRFLYKTIQILDRKFMKKSNNSLTIFQWNDLDIEELKQAHERAYKMRLCTIEQEGNMYRDENNKLHWDVNFIEIPKEGRKKKKINWNILLPKYKFLCHNIIARCSGIKGGASFNSVILEKVLGEYYSVMLETLVDCKYIWLGTYKVGEESRTIWLRNLSICKETTINKKIISYNKKMKELVKDLYKPLSKDLSKPYCKALKTLTLNQEEAKKATNEKFSSFLNKEGNLTEKEYKEQEKEYTWRISRIDTFEYIAPKQDENGRIYHYLTNFPKELLPYTNIKYELDASNCHPMLLCLLLIYFYNISNIKINNINYNLNSSTIYIHYVMNFLHKAFTDSELEGFKKNRGNSVPEDVEKYIQRTFQGRFWDDFVDKFPKVPRGEVKQVMFAEVFYSYDNTIYLRDETVKDKFKAKYAKKYAKAFKEDYPNVWKLIGQIKKIGRKRLEGESDEEQKNSFFPCVMMKLESAIFREILSRCYDRGYTNIINIHDAICVIENDTLNYTSDDIKNIMLEVFDEYGLHPNLKLEMIKTA